MHQTRSSFSFGNFEEFNLNTGLRFKGEIKNSKLLIVHELNSEELKATQLHLEALFNYQSIELVKAEEFIANISNYNPASTLILILHLDLQTEIKKHQEISLQCFKHGLFQLNPYNKIAKLFDDKYLFYILMKANEIKQAETINLPINYNDISILKKLQEVIIKPRHGTEKIDTQYFANPNLGLALIDKIHQYDDVIVQEFIKHVNEYKITFINGQFFSRIAIKNKELKNYLNDLIDIIDNYARSNQILMPSMFSIDILEQESGEFIVLEANIRAAGIYKFTHELRG